MNFNFRIFQNTSRHLKFNPIKRRHSHQISQNVVIALRDIDAGEELLGNYITYSKTYDEDGWKEMVQDLIRQCSGGEGLVTSIEKDDQ